MPEVNYTKEQKQAIYERDANLLVAAAAGSGKTAVLVERIINIITNEQQPVDIDRLLVVTFTEAAATEMRQRISQAIMGALEKEPLNEHLRRQAALINKAPISTIHAFCNSVVRQNFHAAGVDPSYRIADSTETGILQDEAMEELFEEEYAKEDNELFYDMIEIYSDRFMDDRFKELVFRIYAFAANSPDPEQWLKEYSGWFHFDDSQGLSDTVWVKLLLEGMIRQLESAAQSAEEALALCNRPGGPHKYTENLKDDAEIIQRLLATAATGSFEKLYAAFQQITFSRLATISSKDTDVDGSLKSMVKEIRDKEIKYTINAIAESVFFKEPSEQKNDLAALYPYMDKLGAIVAGFGKHYTQKKFERNILDFNDLEHYALKILVENKEIALSLQNHYYEIFVDEYQDSNIVQEMILSAIAGACNRFMVGDIKQSIYKFRRAKPEIFIEKYNRYSDSGPNRKILLSQNFRSRKEVVDTVNFVFRQLMSAQMGDIHYEKDEELYLGANYPEAGRNTPLDNTTELLIAINEKEQEPEGSLSEGAETLEELSNAELESRMIAKRIEQLTGGKGVQPAFIYDKNTGEYRKAAFGDIVILLRSMKNAGVIIEQLGRKGIPAYAEVSAGYFQNIEVLTVLSYLRIIDNPRQDIHLIGVLHSPIYAVDANGLYEIRNKTPNRDFYTAVKNYAMLPDRDPGVAGCLERFMADLDYFRNISAMTPASKLINLLVTKTNYYNYIGVMAGGKLRQGNIKALEEHAVQYEKTSFKGLFYFIRYMEKLIHKDTKLSDAKITAQNENAVRLMTIHKSKGLEFPIVFVSMLNGRFNKLDERQDIILHQDYGFGPRYTDIKMRVKYDTLARIALAEKTQQENYAEELRVLYVALTRAKEKLILTACLPEKGFDKKMERWSRLLNHKELKLPAMYMLKALSYMDWLMPAFLRNETSRDLLNLYGVFLGYGNRAVMEEPVNFRFQLFHGAESPPAITGNEDEEEPASVAQLLASLKTDAFPNEAVYAAVDQKLSWEYPYRAAEKLPSKILISEIKRNYFSQKRYESGEETFQEEQPVYKEPEFLVEKRGLNAVEKGTAVHTVMEHIDFIKDNEIGAIQNRLVKLVRRNILTNQEMQSIPVAKIWAFIQSPLAERIRNSPVVQKETPFVMHISPEEAYVEGDFDSEARVMVHGIIDLYFEEEDGLVIVDYKTDYIDNSDFELLIQRYKIQLSIYKKALESATGKKVKECMLYLFYSDKYISV